MGATNSNDNRKQIKGGVAIEIQKIVYTSNEIIQGKVHILLEEPYPGSILNIELIGQENTQFIYRTRSNKRTVVHHAKGFNQFLNFSIPIYDFSNGQENYTIMPGQWTIPFTLTIADKLPSSIDYELNANYKCSLKYFLGAFIPPRDNQYRVLNNNQQIYIGQNVKLNNENYFFTVTSKPETCCCCGNGQMALQATLEGQRFCPGQTIKMKFQGDFSQLRIQTQKIIVRLQGLIVMKSEQTQRNFSKIINYVEIELPVKQKQMIENLNINIPSNCFLTCLGSLISLNYTISVEAIFDKICISSNQQLIIPIIINPAKTMQYHGPIELQQIKAPVGWDPQQLQLQQYDQQRLLFMKQQTQRYMQLQNTNINQDQIYGSYSQQEKMLNQNCYM